MPVAQAARTSSRRCRALAACSEEPAASRGRSCRRRCARSTRSSAAWMTRGRHARAASTPPATCAASMPARRRTRPATASSARTSTPSRTPARSTASSAWCIGIALVELLGGRALAVRASRSSASPKRKASASACRSSAAAPSSAPSTTSCSRRRDARRQTRQRRDSRLRSRPRAHRRRHAARPRARLSRVPHRAGTGARPLGLPLASSTRSPGRAALEIDVHRRRRTMPARRRWARRDALAGAAEWIVAVERRGAGTPGLVATVGRIEAQPGATNVIAGDAVRRSTSGMPDDAHSAAGRCPAARCAREDC